MLDTSCDLAGFNFKIYSVSLILYLSGSVVFSISDSLEHLAQATPETAQEQPYYQYMDLLWARIQRTSLN